MEQKNNMSEVARLLQQIDEEYCAAKQGLTGFAESARHAAITTRMEHMGQIHANLCALIGDEAIRLIAERIEIIPEEEEAKRAGPRTGTH